MQRPSRTARSLALATALCGLAAVASTAITAVRAARPDPDAAMAQAAQRFLASLGTAERQAAAFPFGSEERFNWQFRKTDRKGLPLKLMNVAQREAAMALLQTGLSARGLEKAAMIREMERIPSRPDPNRAPRDPNAPPRTPPPPPDPERYFFLVFGEPSTSGNWAWRYEGHHCVINWTIVGGKVVSSSPAFFGSEPAEVREVVPGAPPKGSRPLPVEDDLGFKLVKSLSEEQRREAVRSDTSPQNIITGAARQAEIQEDTGVAYKSLNSAQRRMLYSLIREYADNQARPLAEKRLKALQKAGLDRVKFAWMGGMEPGQGHYYRIQGPTFLIEFDNTQTNANHIHSVWRDFKGDFGMDLLAMHYRASPHPRLASK